MDETMLSYIATSSPAKCLFLPFSLPFPHTSLSSLSFPLSLCGNSMYQRYKDANIDRSIETPLVSIRSPAYAPVKCWTSLYFLGWNVYLLNYSTVSVKAIAVSVVPSTVSPRCLVGPQKFVGEWIKLLMRNSTRYYDIFACSRIQMTTYMSQLNSLWNNFPEV